MLYTYHVIFLGKIIKQHNIIIIFKQIKFDFKGKD